MANLSCIIPAFNEEGSVESVVRATEAVLERFPGCHEIIVIDDASTDKTPGILARLATEIPTLRSLRNKRNLGCHPSEVIGFDIAEGDVLFFLPADGQISPEELPSLLNQWPVSKLIFTHRINRADNPLRKFVSATYNLVLRLALGIDVQDIDSAILIDRQLWERMSDCIRTDSAFVNVRIFLAAKELGAGVTEVPIRHYPRTTGQAHGLNMRDLSRVPVHFAKVWWELRRGRFLS